MDAIEKWKLGVSGIASLEIVSGREKQVRDGSTLSAPGALCQLPATLVIYGVLNTAHQSHNGERAFAHSSSYLCRINKLSQNFVA